ncbi:hypothetical protein JCM19294_2359 [Nonlabens tegetincola]|uniref:Secretion system C-terminal sorting domain-containing protein n=1 Tax=Nonlabens tegetincola TaxID=323273 RepID=A0A090Q080_9FLAO|nr:YCF48-related protein [Nonlabens tegetincola]GAK95577.1 hypothetical protein JCM19294_2359 [Nonlabens tegetincola]
MRIALLSFIVLLTTTTFRAQQPDWIFRTPIKNISEITEVEVSPDGSIFLFDKVNLLNRMYISENDGNSYRLEGNGQGFDLQVLRNDLAYIVNRNRVIKSNDKFRSTINYNLPSSGFSTLYFLNENEGYVAGGNGKLIKTIDGGSNWTTLNVGTTETIRDIHFIDSNTGFVVGDDISFYRTDDGGTTWTSIALPIQNFWTLTKIDFRDSLNGIIIASGGFIFYTNDAGLTWNQSTSGTNERLNDLVFHNNTYYVVGNDGNILSSNDQGLSWSLQDIGRDDLLSIDASATKLYIGLEGAVLESIDGTTWNSHLNDFIPSSLEQASFGNNATGLVVGLGNNGSAVFRDVMYRTTDYGVTWDRKTVSGGYHAVHLKPNGEALTTRGNISRVSYSDDFGDTWINITGPNITQQFIAKDVWLKSRDDFFVVGGNFFASDGIYRYQTGSGWSHITTTGNTEYIDFLDDLIGIATNTSNQAFKTIDGGSSWNPINYTGGNFEGIQLIDANTFYIGQQVSYDGGQTFQYNNFPGFIGTFKFFTPSYGIGITTSTGDLYLTTDAGTTWQLLLNTIEDGAGNYFITEETIYGFGSNSDIVTLDISGLLNFENVPNTRSQIELYPNPASDQINIACLNNTINRLEIYNLQGKLVKKCKLSPDQLNNISIQELGKGVYFFRLLNDQQVIEIHKLIKK